MKYFKIIFLSLIVLIFISCKPCTPKEEYLETIENVNKIEYISGNVVLYTPTGVYVYNPADQIRLNYGLIKVYKTYYNCSEYYYTFKN